MREQSAPSDMATTLVSQAAQIDRLKMEALLRVNLRPPRPDRPTLRQKRQHRQMQQMAISRMTALAEPPAVEQVQHDQSHEPATGHNST